RPRRPRAAAPGGRAAGGAPGAARQPRAGDHRERDHGQARRRDRGAAPVGRAWHRPGDRRLRGRPVLVRQPAPAAGARAEDRQDLRRAPGQRARGPAHRAFDRRARAPPRLPRHRRGRGPPRRAGLAGGHRLRSRPGLHDREGDAGAGVRRVPRRRRLARPARGPGPGGAGLMRPARLLLLGLAVSPFTAQAQAAWHGYLDLRLAAPASEQDWGDGGLGKTRFGGGNVDASASAALGASFQLAPELLAAAELQVQPEQERAADVLEAWVRWRPVSTTPWRWSLRAGVFFPPVSLENDGPGWTSAWTLTPSAINSWVGEELRATGAEFRLEHRARAGTWSATIAAFGRNDPAGDLLASRGWAMGDLTTGAFGTLREPDVYAPVARTTAPVMFHPFREIDHRVGWYGALQWDGAGGRGLTLLRYDNRADPTAWEWQGRRKVFAWHTRFWSLGGQARIGDITLLAQAMRGATAFEPQPGLYLDTELAAGYLLAGWDRGAWQPAL